MKPASQLQDPSASQNVRTVRVDLGARGYDIIIGRGLLTDADSWLSQAVGDARAVIVTDENVAGHHLQALELALQPGGRHIGSVTLPAGEQSKSFAQLQKLCEQLLILGVERGDTIIALGGGVIGDLTGFAASIVRRGVRTVQIPTSLLAQVDSSVGGKTGINTPQGKNLIGTFHQPSLVLADTGLLDSLPWREFCAGYAEVIKYGLLGDDEFFQWLDINKQAIFARDQALLDEAIARSCAAKAEIVIEDEHEHGRRALLNLGHTFGHALEAWAGYGERLLHGEAVAIGMAMAFRFSEQTGLCPDGTAERVIAHLAAIDLPVRMLFRQGETPPSVDTILDLMAQDKKVIRGSLTFILVRGIGQAFVTRDVSTGRLRDFLQQELTE